MKKLAMTAAALLIGTAMPAWAQSACTPPAQPTPIDGASATKDAMIAYHSAVTGYIAASDAYQQCLQSDIDTQTAAAKKANTSFDSKPDIDAATANQASKKTVADAYGVVLAAYKKAQPAK